MSVKQKFVYECVCDRCGKKDLLDTPPVMVSIFKCRKEYLCKSCLKNFLSETYGGEWDNDKVDERSFIIKIGNCEETVNVNISIKNNDIRDELESLKKLFNDIIGSLVYKGLRSQTISESHYSICQTCNIFKIGNVKYDEISFVYQILKLDPEEIRSYDVDTILFVRHKQSPLMVTLTQRPITNDCIVKRIK